MSEVDRARRTRERGDGHTWRERALATEAEAERLKKALSVIANGRYGDASVKAKCALAPSEKDQVTEEQA